VPLQGRSPAAGGARDADRRAAGGWLAAGETRTLEIRLSRGIRGDIAAARRAHRRLIASIHIGFYPSETPADADSMVLDFKHLRG